jgi:1-phosphofructokinase family hexose kinase
MLLTVTSNPTIDRTLYVPKLVVGTVHRTTAVHLAAGGKGLNVSRVARVLGCQALATGPLAGRAGQIVADLALQEGLLADWYWLSAGETRTCLVINHDTGDATVINEQGPAVSPEGWAGFAAHIKRLARQAKAVAFSGSLPLGVDPAALGKSAREAVTAGCTVYVDTSGPALAALLIEPQGACIKVNQAELATEMGLNVEERNSERLVEAGQQVLGRGAAQVVITLGSRGALAVTPMGVWQAIAPVIEVVSTVGSGDSMLAGLAVARLRGKPFDQALAFGVACGSANALSDLPGRFEIGQVERLLGQTQIVRL